MINLEAYIRKQVEAEIFPQNSNLTVFCGHHGHQESDDSSRMGVTFPEFTDQVKKALKNVERECKEIKIKKGYSLSGNIIPVSLEGGGQGILESCSEEVRSKLKDLIASTLEEPSIILFASCFSEYGDFKEFVLESGVCSVVLLRNERGSITKGKCFQLDETQAKLIELLRTDHWQAESPDELKLRNLILTGRFGTGKTLVITEGTWMRINFCLRKIREYGM